MKEVLNKTKFDDLRAHFKPSKLPFSKDSKKQAEKILKGVDFPTRKNERWKYTSLNGLAKLTFDGSQNDEITTPVISSSAKRIIIKNGLIEDRISLNGVKTHWESMPEILEEETFDALNLLHCTSAIEIVFDKENFSDIELVFQNTTNNFIFPRTYIKCRRGAKGNVILNFQGSVLNSSFVNASTFVEVEENAHLSIHKIQKNGSNAFDLQREYVNQAANSSFTMNTFCLSGRLTRNDLHIKVNGMNCDTFMNGAYTLKGRSHCDNHTTVDHKVANCFSKELYKGVIDDRATNVFNGKVFVRKDAQKINAFQSNANILLSETGSVNSKPELEIYADDVKCSHGSTTGQLDEEAVFYLRSRGLSEKSAKELLVKAFIGEVLEEIRHEEVRAYVEEQIELHFSV